MSLINVFGNIESFGNTAIDMNNEILLNYGNLSTYIETKNVSGTTAKTYKDKRPRHGILEHL